MSTSIRSRSPARRRNATRLIVSALLAITGHGHAVAQTQTPTSILAPVVQISTERQAGGTIIQYLRNRLHLDGAASREKRPIVRLGAAQTGRLMLMAEADDHFPLWQARADHKLKSEGSLGVFAEHVLATENPNDFIVVCEAGCRDSKDRIVSRTSRKHQPLLAEVNQDTSSSLPTPVPASVAARRTETTGGERLVAQSAITCIAGCSDKPNLAVRVALINDAADKRSTAPAQRNTRISARDIVKEPDPVPAPNAAAWLAVTEVIPADHLGKPDIHLPPSRLQTGFNGAIIGPQRALARAHAVAQPAGLTLWRGAMAPASNARSFSDLRQTRAYKKIRGPYRSGARVQNLFAR